MVAEVIINSIVKNLNRVFDYNIPINLEDKIKIGSRVLVPFGNGKKLEDAFVINIKESSKYKIKDILKFEENVLIDENINLAKWMSKRYFCNISDCLKLMLPPGTSTKNAENRAKEKTANFIYLKKSIDEIDLDIENKILKSEKQVKILKFLGNNSEVIFQDLEIFVGATRAVVKTLEKNGYIEIIEKEIKRNPFINKNIQKDEKRKLTHEQQDVITKVDISINNNEYKQFLIYGVTGSRKNRSIYAINRKSTKQKQISNSISTRNKLNTTDGR